MSSKTFVSYSVCEKIGDEWGTPLAGSTSTDEARTNEFFAKVRGVNIANGRTFGIIKITTVTTREVVVSRKMG